jgi:hypothetical protein
MILLLEGGYDLQVIENGAAMAGRILAGADVEKDPLGSGPAAPEPARAAAVIAAACAAHDLPAPSIM